MGLLKEIERKAKLAIIYNKTGYPRKAIRLNKQAIKQVDELKKMLVENDAVFNCNDFLIGNSNITRKSKIKNNL